MDLVAGRNASVAIQLHKPATVGSVTYTLYDHSGVGISGVIDVPVVTTVAQMVLSISVGAINLSITSPKRFEKRKLVVSYIVNGQSFTVTTDLRVVPMLNITTAPEDVRGYIGLNDTELPDADIDIFTSYLEVEALIGKTAFDTALTSGTLDEQQVNKAIVLQSAINLLPSLALRMAQSETNGIVGFTRQTKIDFSKLLDAARSKLTDIVSSISAREETSLSLVLLTQPTDVITGA